MEQNLPLMSIEHGHENLINYPWRLAFSPGRGEKHDAPHLKNHSSGICWDLQNNRNFVYLMVKELELW